MTAVCVTTFESLWLIAGVSACGVLGASKELTSSFFPRLKATIGNENFIIVPDSSQPDFLRSCH